jgi:hypothetical protein
MVNEQLPWLKPFIQQDQPGLAWRTKGRRENGVFALAVRGRQSKSLRLLKAKAFSRSLPKAERLSCIRPPLTAGYKRTSTLCVFGDSAVNTLLNL